MTSLHPRSLAALVALAAVTSAGCGAPKQYGRFAQAGSAYTAAVDRLLVTAARTGIDATSERLLHDAALRDRKSVV